MTGTPTIAATRPELSLVLTSIEALETHARATQAASATRGYDAPAAVTVTRFREPSFLTTLQDICIDAHEAQAEGLRQAAWELYNEYRLRPGAVTTAEVLAACATLRTHLGN